MSMGQATFIPRVPTSQERLVMRTQFSALYSADTKDAVVPTCISDSDVEKGLPILMEAILFKRKIDQSREFGPMLFATLASELGQQQILATSETMLIGIMPNVSRWLREHYSGTRVNSLVDLQMIRGLRPSDIFVTGAPTADLMPTLNRALALYGVCRIV